MFRPVCREGIAKRVSPIAHYGSSRIILSYRRAIRILKRFGIKTGNGAALQIFVVDMDEKEAGGDEISDGERSACHKI
jgi:hypothetical protein